MALVGAHSAFITVTELLQTPVADEIEQMGFVPARTVSTRSRFHRANPAFAPPRGEQLHGAASLMPRPRAMRNRT